ncbi:MAG: hypothetical protein IJM45_08115 [Clostridia bacterium]|nr:hypothetical protein [Clostridia bacterium]
MAWNEHRFKVISKEGGSLSEAGIRQILVDRETGVHYLLWKAGYGAGITPLLGADGKPVVDLSDI